MLFSCRAARTLGAVGSGPAGAARPATSIISTAGDGRKRPYAADTARAERVTKARAESAKEQRPTTSVAPTTTVRPKAPNAQPEVVVLDDPPTAAAQTAAPDTAPSSPARRTGGEVAAASADVGVPSADTAPSAAEVRATTAQAGPEAGPSAAATKETAPDTEMVVRETGLAHGAELVEKFRTDNADTEVDPEADLAQVRTGRLEQLPSATHARLLSAATEMKGFAEGMIAKLSAADYSLLVSVSIFLWGRASAPTRCSPRDSG